jgi:hypothetical protein
MVEGPAGLMQRSEERLNFLNFTNPPRNGEGDHAKQGGGAGTALGSVAWQP